MKTALKTLACITAGLVVGVAIKRVNDELKVVNSELKVANDKIREALYFSKKLDK